MWEDLIPTVLFLTIGAVLASAFYFRYLTRREVQATLRQAIEQGQTISPELIASLSEMHSAPRADLRRGIISIALGLGVAAFALLLGEPTALRPILGLSAFPLIIGIAYLGLAFVLHRKSD